MKADEASRTGWPDYAKAIGIILVVYGHVASGVFNAGLMTDVDAFQITESVVYSFHMPLFFFLSGLFFLSSVEKRSPKSFLLSKANTILYPYVIWSIVQGTLEVVLSHYTNGHASMASVLTLVWKPRAQFWFLYVLFFSFALALLIYRRPSSKTWCAGVLAGSILLNLFGDFLPDIYLISMLKHYFVYFSLGTFATFFLGQLNVNWTARLVAIAVIFSLSQWVFHFELGLRYNDDVPSIILLMAFIGIALIVALSQWLAQFDLPWLAYLGRHSMTIYLVHILAASGCRIILLKIVGVTDVEVHLLVGTLGGLLIPLIFYWFCSKAKLGFLFSPPNSI